MGSHNVIVGINDLKSQYPDIAMEWDNEKNSPILPEQIAYGSGKVFWWKCKEGHSFEAKPNNRTAGKQGCPYCAGKKAIEGVNSLADIRKELLQEWDYGKNDILPTEVTVSSGKRVWWICQKCGNEWKSVIASRSQGYGCPKCAAKNRGEQSAKADIGINDLQSQFPDIAKEWNNERNGLLKPIHIKSRSNKKVWWKCNNNHEWCATIASRTDGNGCPYCAGQRLIVGQNDLETVFPYIAEEWDYEKNAPLRPSDVMSGARKLVWWICEQNHSYKADISVRTRKSGGTGCPICNKEKQTSFPEQAIYYYIKQYFSDAINGDRVQLDGKELDIFIPSIHTAIEYDGINWHKDTEKDLLKNKLCTDKGITLYRIREGKVASELINKGSFVYCYDYGDYDKLNRIIEDILVKLKIKLVTDIVIQRDSVKIQAQYVKSRKKNSIFAMYPEISCEWDYKTNYPITPENINSGSNKKYWWICNKGHSYSALVCDRTKNGSGCPYCSNKKVLIGFNDLLTCHPELEVEWDFERNEDNPKDYVSGSGKKVWWKCKICGNKWKSQIASRAQGYGCPKCADRRNGERKATPVIGDNDLLSNYPELVKEWDFVKNDISPDMVCYGSKKRVWWICNEGHSYQTVVGNRTILKNGCPYCTNRRVLSGFNDLLTVNPDLMTDWDYSKNEIKPDEVCSGSRIKVWWKCSAGHSYYTSILLRERGCSCPYCSNQKVLLGYNDLQTTDPELTQEWNYDKNEILPTEVVRGSVRKVWWKCSKGHEWQSVISKRTKEKHGCPICSGKKILAGYNDLATLVPQLLGEWDYDKNEIKPNSVGLGSNKKVWWKCSEGHEWQTAVYHRTGDKPTGCPFCKKRKT